MLPSESACYNGHQIWIRFFSILAASWLPLAALWHPQGRRNASQSIPKSSPKAILLPIATQLRFFLHFDSNLHLFWLNFPAFCFPFLIIWASFFDPLASLLLILSFALACRFSRSARPPYSRSAGSIRRASPASTRPC